MKTQLGQQLIRSVPWKTGRYTVTVMDKRPPVDGEYYLTHHAVVRRVGTSSLPQSQRQREHWIVSVGEKV